MLLLIGSAWRWTTASDAVAGDASLFMNQLWGQTVEVLSKKVPGAERLTRFRQLYLADFDGPGIARFVLAAGLRAAAAGAARCAGRAAVLGRDRQASATVRAAAACDGAGRCGGERR